MAVFEVRGGPVTFRYLERKYTKTELIREHLWLLSELDKANQRIADLEGAENENG